MTTASGPVATRRRRRGSEAVAEGLLDAALVEFAAHGFHGASTRAIAERASAHQPQINYHFASKELLWHAAVDHLFDLLAVAIDEPGSGEPPAGPGEVLAELVRRFVRFSAGRPELHRIMNLESTADSPRLTWIIERHVKPRFEQLEALWTAVQVTGVAADLSPLEAWETLIGVGALPFANAPLLTRLTDFDPVGSGSVEAHAERVIAILLPRLAR